MPNNKLVIVIALLGVIGCNNTSNNIEKQEAAIYSLLIDKMAKPFPPPPPPPKDGLEPKPVNKDSISKIKVEVLVDTIMFHVSETVDLAEEYSENQNLVDNISSLAAKPLKTEYINSEKGHTLKFGSPLEESDIKYPQMLGISRIAFNEKKNKAALYAGYSTHPLASYLELYLLKKIKGKWQIVHEKTMEVS